MNNLSPTNLRDVSLAGKKILIRFDGDVPTDETGQTITDDYRLKSVMPTLNWCIDSSDSIVLLAHRGRPEGKVDPLLSNKILADYFTAALGQTVEIIANLGERASSKICLLENLRFWSGEEDNDPDFTARLASYGDIYCNDAFAVSHRQHASIVGLPSLLTHVAGFRLVEELQNLTPLLDHADAPFIAVLGGAKSEDKLPVISHLIDHVDHVIIGGLVAVAYLLALGHNVGAHNVNQDQVKIARASIRQMHEAGVDFAVPIDFINQDKTIKPITSFLPTDTMLDIGPKTIEKYSRILNKGNTIFWNGAMGKSEDAAFAGGTINIARAIGDSGAAKRIASGGDTVGAIHQNNLERMFTFISTGGGATLEFLAGKELPGVKVLVS